MDDLICSKCGFVQPLSNFPSISKKGKVCRKCISELDKKYREENSEKISNKRRKYREENREKTIEGQKRWREENREKWLEGKRRYREENREKTIEGQRRWREENREKWLDGKRRYRVLNKDKVRELELKHIILRSLKLNSAPKELIELKREHLLLKRLIKELDK